MIEVLSARVQALKRCERPLGTRRHPARTCRDLKQLEPNVTNGKT